MLDLIFWLAVYGRSSQNEDSNNLSQSVELESKNSNSKRNGKSMLESDLLGPLNNILFNNVTGGYENLFENEKN